MCGPVPPRHQPSLPTSQKQTTADNGHDCHGNDDEKPGNTRLTSGAMRRRGALYQYRH